MAAAPAKAQFTPNDQTVSDPLIDLNDPEFDQAGNRLTWQEDSGAHLWVASLDPETGDMIPATGKGQLIDTGLMPIGISLNGPEWAYGTNGTYIVYSKTAAGHNLIGAAHDMGLGSWALSSVDSSDLNRWRPIGSPPGTIFPAREAYIWQRNGNQHLAWRDIDSPTSERTLAIANPRARFVPGEDYLLTTMQVDAYQQVIGIDAETGLFSQFTFDSGNKNFPTMWYAPDLGRYVFMAQLGTTAIGIYANVGGVWTDIYGIRLPSTKPFISSPEPFVYKHKSYVFAVAAQSLGQVGNFPYEPIGPTEIWIAGIDPKAPFFRRVDDPDGDHHRLDPEVYDTTSDAMIYYTQRDDGTVHSLLRRAATGLSTQGTQ